MSSVDDVAAFWDSRPCNVRHSNLLIGSAEYFAAVRQKRYFAEPHISEFADFPAWTRKSVLEIGCGIGTDAVEFARHGAMLTAVDLSPKSLEICRRRFQVLGLPGEFYEANIERLSNSVPAKKYDLIYSFGVLHHTPSPVAAIAEIKKCCGPQSELRIMVYAKWSTKAIAIAFWHGWRDAHRHSEAQSGCPITWMYSISGVRKLLADFEIVSIRKCHIFPYRIDEYVRHEYVKRWYWRICPGPLFHLIERVLGWHILVVATLKETAK